MAKRKTSRKKKAPAKRKAAEPKQTQPEEDAPWNICDDCIEPLCHGFFKIVDVWSSRTFPPKPHYEYDFDRYFELHQELAEILTPGAERGDSQRYREIVQQLGWEPPTVDDLDLAYDVCDFDFAVNWLKVHLSIEFANEFKSTVMGPADRLCALEDRACQMLDIPGIMVPPALQRCILAQRSLFVQRARAVNIVLLGRYKYLRETLKPEKWRSLDPMEDGILWKLIRAHADIEQEVMSVLDYLNYMDIILEAKFSDTEIDQKAVPPGQRTVPMSKTTIAEIFTCHRNQVDEILSRYWHEEIGSRSRMLVADMPDTYPHAIDRHKERIGGPKRRVKK